LFVVNSISIKKQPVFLTREIRLFFCAYFYDNQLKFALIDESGEILKIKKIDDMLKKIIAK